MYKSQKLLTVLTSLALLASLALLFVTLTHPLAPVGAAKDDKVARQFYLTRTTHNGAQALSACARGYHMASLWEIHDPSNLRYDTELGLTRDDSGFGPPAAVLGWIRTGLFASDALAPGEANCNAWTEAGELQYGSAVTLIGSWNSPEERVISPWVAEVTQCSGSRFVWCVQD